MSKPFQRSRVCLFVVIIIIVLSYENFLRKSKSDHLHLSPAINLFPPRITEVWIVIGSHLEPFDPKESHIGLILVEPNPEVYTQLWNRYKVIS